MHAGPLYASKSHTRICRKFSIPLKLQLPVHGVPSLYLNSKQRDVLLLVVCDFDSFDQDCNAAAGSCSWFVSL
jgi:hypothetical protein